MKIIYLHQYFTTPEMAGGTRSYEMARRLVNKGHEVHVVTSWREKTGFLAYTYPEGIHVHWVHIPYSNEMPYMRRILAFVKYCIWAGIKCFRLKGDLVFATSTPLTVAIPGVICGKLQRIPLVFEVRDLWPALPIAMGAIKSKFLMGFTRRLERWAYLNSEVVVALSPGMKEGVVEAGISSDRVVVIPNSCDLNIFDVPIERGLKFRSSRLWLQDRPLIIYTGTFGRINGVGYMVALAKELLKIAPDIRILLIGGGYDLLSITRAAESAGVLNVNLFIEPAMPKSEIAGALSAATISSSLFIDLPEMRVNSANKFFDSLASSTPIIINYCGWQKTILERFDCGICSWDMSYEKAALLIKNRLSDNVWLLNASLSAKNVAQEFFSRDELATRLELILRLAKDAHNKNYLDSRDQHHNIHPEIVREARANRYE